MGRILMIAAIGKNRELGKNNQMIWHLKKDLAFFKKTTLQHRVVMGVNTYRSLPNALPGRTMQVISSSIKELPDAEIYGSLEAFLEENRKMPDPVFVIGGQSLYTQMLPYADTLYLTHIEAEDPEADTYFPAFDPACFTAEELQETEENGIRCRYVKYERILPAEKA